MKKLITGCIAIVASFLISNSASAQVKIGYFDEQQILSLMPGIGKIDTLLQKFATDSLAPERDQLMSDFKNVDSLLKDSTKKTIPESLKKVLIEQAQGYMYKLQNWQQYQTQVLQYKQEQLVAPYKKPIEAALQEVIREQKYTIILKPETVVWMDNSEDIPLRVLAKLNLPNLPKQVQDQINAIRGNSGPSATPKAPAKPKK